MNLKQNFGQRLKTMREERNLTQEQLGKAVRVDYKHIGAIERGIRAPSFDLIERLSKELKCPWHQFFLPTSGRAPELETEIAAVLGESDQQRRATITRLLTAVIRAAKKLEKV